MLNPEIKTKWLEALRSGKYKQAEAALHYKDSFCCLGVLCDIISPTGWDDYENFTYKGETQSGFPPRTLCEEIGLPIPIPIYDMGKTTITNDLADKNDKGMKFPEIADFIEANL